MVLPIAATVLSQEVNCRLAVFHGNDLEFVMSRPGFATFYSIGKGKEGTSSRHSHPLGNGAVASCTALGPWNAGIGHKFAG